MRHGAHRQRRPRAARRGPAPPPVRSVERALAVLDCLADEDLRLVDLAERSGLHKATAARLLASLSAAGMVARNDRERYTIGPGILRLAGRHLGRYRSLLDLLHPSLKRLWEETGETVTVHIRVGAYRVCVEELESRQAIAYRAGVGNQVPLNSGSAAKVLLAFLPADEQREILDQLAFAPLTARTITRREVMEAELERVRRQGFATSLGERIEGAAAVSVPVLDRDGRAQAAVSILGPELRMTPPVLERHTALLRQLMRPRAVPVDLSAPGDPPPFSPDPRSDRSPR